MSLSNPSDFLNTLVSTLRIVAAILEALPDILKRRRNVWSATNQYGRIKLIADITMGVFQRKM